MKKTSHRVALLTPYNGGNLGDAAIQDAVIANLRQRLPGARFAGISLNCDSFAERHCAAGGFPLCATSRRFYGMSSGSAFGNPATSGVAHFLGMNGTGALTVQAVPNQTSWFRRGLRKARAWVTVIPREIRHWFQGYLFLRTQDVVIVSGGGQLDEEWGGPWGHPYALFKWGMLARMAGVPCAVVSVGAGKLKSIVSRFFLSAALRMASYRSYRDVNTKDIAARLFDPAGKDLIVPDLAFSLSPIESLPLSNVQALAKGRSIVAISPIAFAKPGSWPRQDQILFERYLSQMASVVSQLLQRGVFVVFVSSSLGDDEHVIPELLDHLDSEARSNLAPQITAPPIFSWKDLAACLRDVDVLIASRLHSLITGIVVQKPVIAIGFDPKVQWLMEDLGQTEYLLQFSDFTAAEVLDCFDRIQLQRDSVLAQIKFYPESIHSTLESQYDTLASLAKHTGLPNSM